MTNELLIAIETIGGYQTRGYPTDPELRRAQPARPARRRLPVLRALAVLLMRKEQKR
jgi:hypothetical protein